MRKLISTILFCSIFIAGCTSESENDYLNGLEEDLQLPKESSVEILEQERDPSYPIYEYVSATEEATRAAATSHTEYLGRSLKFEHFPLEDTRNIGWPVINTSKYIEQNPDRYNCLDMKYYIAQYYAFSSFDSYEEKSEVTNKINSGKSINLGFFKIGSKKSYQEVFKISYSETSQSVYGNLNIEYLHYKYAINLNDITNKKIKQEGYLSKGFMEDIHHISPERLVAIYGPFVISEFETGGRLEALYTASHESTTLSTTKETDLSNAIEAGFTFKESDNTADISVGSGQGSSSSNSYLNKFSEVYMTLKTIGGSPTYPTYSTPEDLSSCFFSLSGWTSSLSDANNHTLVNYSNNSLYFLSDYIMEQNLVNYVKSAISNYSPDYDSSYNSLAEPVIYLLKKDHNVYSACLLRDIGA